MDINSLAQGAALATLLVGMLMHWLYRAQIKHHQGEIERCQAECRRLEGV